MNKGLAWGIGLVVGLPVVAVATGAILVNTIDQQAMLNEMSGVVKEDLGRELKFNGPVQLKWFPSIGVQLEQVSLSEYQSEQRFLNAEKVDVSLALMPLFSSNIVVDEVQADGVSVRVVKNKEGKFNFDDLTGGAKDEQQSAVEEAPASGQSLNFSVEAISLSNLNLEFEDQQQDLKASLENFNFTSGRIEPDVPTTLSFSGRVKANKPSADLQVTLNSGLQFGLGENLYAETPASGAPMVGYAQDEGFGRILQGALEASNVEIVTEMVDMIAALRAYEINSKAVKVSEQMSETANAMVR